MTEHHKFSILTENFSPERKAKIAAQTAKLKEEMVLTELRQNTTRRGRNEVFWKSLAYRVTKA
ncbi:hypothetical protein [Scytonema sp. UIC 10036]|uniref:hypothetical protein n=1 Tax=Scytonema sp. UIC 10036 TaxID=2304196 RepID=UPI001FAB1912|nr:hypothetical protein [Scytonema sp. UIC 10036]